MLSWKNPPVIYLPYTYGLGKGTRICLPREMYFSAAPSPRPITRREFGSMGRCLPFDTIEDYSPKAYKITVGSNLFYIPKSQCFEVLPGGLYASEFVLKDAKAPAYMEADCKYFEAQTNTPVSLPKPQPKKEVVFMPYEALEETLTGFDINQFINNLLQNIPFPFEPEAVNKIISMYYLGTIQSGYLKGGVCFPFIDINGNIRTIQAKTFDKGNHTTNTGFYHAMLKKRSPRADWLNTYLENDSFVSCLFGEHLLSKYPNNPVALIEAPKGAILGSLYFGLPNESPANMLWLSTYNLSSLTFEKCKVLKGRFVTLFPDLSKTGKAFELWANRAKQFNEALPGTKFTVSTLLETKASPAEREAAADLADYLIKYDWRIFRKPEPLPEPEPIEAVIIETEPRSMEAPPADIEPEPMEAPPAVKLWDIEAIEDSLAKIALPNTPIRLTTAEVIINPEAMVKSHLDYIKANNGNPLFLPYLARLQNVISMAQ